MKAFYCFFSFFLFLSGISAKLKQVIDDISKYEMSREEILKSPHYRNKVFNIEMSTSDGEELMEHWANQGFSGLIAAIATRRLHLVEPYQKRNHMECSSEAETLAEHAKCLIELEKCAHENRLIHRKRFFNKKFRSQINRMGHEVKRTAPNDWVGSFKFARAKREIKIHNRAGFELKTENDRTPFGMMAEHLSNVIRAIKGKKNVSRWQETIERIGEKAKEVKEEKRIERFLRKRMNNFGKAATRINKMKRRETKPKKTDQTIREIEALANLIDDEEIKEILVNKASNMTYEEKLMIAPIKLIREAAKIGLMIGGYNMTGIDKKNIRIASPKLMSVVSKDEEANNNEIDLFSPSLFSLHSDGTGIEKKASLKNLLGSLTNSQDSQKLLDFIIEATGVDEAMIGVEEKLKETRRQRDEALGRGPEGQPLYWTKENVTERYPEEARKIELMEELDKMYTPQQLRDLNRTGYTVLNDQQLSLVYGKGSVVENLKFLEKTRNLSRSEVDRTIMKTINGIAQEKLKFQARKNDVVLSPVVMTSFIFNPAAVSAPTILSPLLLVSLIGSPSIYGVTVLSPWLMVPVVLSPRLMCPTVLTPFVMVPVILTPLALHPFILCPGLLNPFVLSPLVLTPFILSPQVMTPLILSPFCLGPIILNPLALSPLILSPFVLSPTILSPQYVTAVMFSPYALSPAWGSDGAAVTVVASPSWLS